MSDGPKKPGVKDLGSVLDAPLPAVRLTKSLRSGLRSGRLKVRGSVRIGKGRFKTPEERDAFRKKVLSTKLP